jgi:hypothetical protein
LRLAAVKYWDKTAYTRDFGKNPSGTAYLEDENGVACTTEAIEALGQYGRRCWQTLHAAGRAPDTWARKIDQVNSEWFQACMYEKFPFLRLCSGDWKLHQWCIQHYPSWADTHVKKKVRNQNKVRKRSHSATLPPDPLLASDEPAQLKRLKTGGCHSFQSLLSFSPVRWLSDEPSHTPNGPRDD